MLQFVYAIIDEREEQMQPEETTAYIGLTYNPNKRFKSHLCEDEGGAAKHYWLQKLRLIEPCPAKMRILEVVDGDRKQGLEREKHWVQEYQSRGVRLVNLHLMMPETIRDSYEAHVSQLEEIETLQDLYRKKTGRPLSKSRIIREALESFLPCAFDAYKDEKDDE